MVVAMMQAFGNTFSILRQSRPAEVAYAVGRSKADELLGLFGALEFNEEVLTDILKQRDTAGDSISEHITEINNIAKNR